MEEQSRVGAGRRALVTGAGVRVGREIALELARAGADVAIHVNRSHGPGEETAEAVRALGRRAIVVAADQRDVAAVRAACDEAESELGPIDWLVNSAATWPHVAIENLEQEDFDAALEVNLRGPFFWAQTLGTRMRARGGGAIVSIADVSFDRPWPDSLPYCMAKAGVVSMTYGLAKALAPRVRVNAVGPGPVLFPQDYPQERADDDRAATLRGREGSPLDVARAVRFLLEAENVTGVLLPVDGGYRFGI
ncbi:SDR family NAD(P)-dependent oxidoreductase [Engelhardtia mirabilis]|uniref:3-oxoacyl-[acyl-carrier-protein] reductase FabG n=1 Tax=Engelhardtia mirabilis TaxID=2528011 RepID=A0A518BRX6_9BACT|nr:3-oxoacyl-[acyl-carrier-protein] reductase FabG [Planctomycetes bacterium Pla133]QDV04042.1 3-oxoacyl-[acyl-carrier-protein] reductase FabG [Planctomycetes bacterium Pla86]